MAKTLEARQDRPLRVGENKSLSSPRERSASLGAKNLSLQEKSNKEARQIFTGEIIIPGNVLGRAKQNYASQIIDSFKDEQGQQFFLMRISHDDFLAMRTSFRDAPLTQAQASSAVTPTEWLFGVPNIVGDLQGLFPKQDGAKYSKTNGLRSHIRGPGIYHELGLDPLVGLQWYMFSWPSLLLDRFPASVEQGLSAFGRLREDEAFFWPGGPTAWRPSAQASDRTDSNRCVNHNPLTTRAQKIWQYFEPGASGKKIVRDDDLPDVYLQDGGVDFTHPELRSLLPNQEARLSEKSHRQEIFDDKSQDVLFFHGTHVAGVMAAARNDQGITGVFPLLRLKNYQIKSSYSGVQISYFDVLKGLSEIEKDISLRFGALSNKDSPAMRPAVILLNYAFPMVTVDAAFGRPVHWLMQSILERILHYNVVVVVPAGNTLRPEDAVFPAQMPSIKYAKGRRGVFLPVGASDLCSQKAWFSQVPTDVLQKQFFAPGEHIFSTFPAEDYGFLSGTSLAAAQVSAVLAAGALVSPNKTADELVSLLGQYAQPLTDIGPKAVMPDAALFLGELFDNPWSKPY